MTLNAMAVAMRVIVSASFPSRCRRSRPAQGLGPRPIWPDETDSSVSDFDSLMRGGWRGQIASTGGEERQGGAGRSEPASKRAELVAVGTGTMLHASTPCAGAPSAQGAAKQLHLLERAGARKEKPTRGP